MEYYTTKDIINKYHFTPDFLNKCLNRLHNIFNGHIMRGNKNARLFSSEAMNILDIIAQKKNDGLSISEIEAFLVNSLESHKHVTTDIKTGQSSLFSVETLQKELNKEIEKRAILQAEKDAIIRTLEQEKHFLEKEKILLESSIKFLTDGRSPEKVREEWIMEEKKKILLSQKIQALKSLSFTQWIKKKKLLKEIEELTS